MANTTFIDKQTIIQADWLNDVNDYVYGGVVPGMGLDSSDVVYTPAGTGAVATTVQAKLRESVSVKDFGAVGDGVADDTVAVQAWADYCALNRKKGTAPAGNYKLTATIATYDTDSFQLVGDGAGVTTFTQHTDNIKIINLGSKVGGSGELHSGRISGITLTYANVQPVANTGAIPLYFSNMAYEWSFDDISFEAGYYAIQIDNGCLQFWGCSWNNIRFGGSISGGCFLGSTMNSGCPNNVYGRMLISATTMKKTLFNIFRGYNCVFHAIEILDLKVPVFRIESGAEIKINAIKVELLDYSAISSWTPFEGNSGLFYIPDCALSIDFLNLSGTYAKFTPSVTGYVFTGNIKKLKIGHAKITPSEAVSNFYVFGTSGTVGRSPVEVESHYMNATAFTMPWSNTGGSEAAESLVIRPDLNSLVSKNKGDADYTIALGDPCNIRFETPLTAIRTVALPSSNDYLFGGLIYRITSANAVNGANTILVKSGGTTIATLSAANEFVEVIWRRNGWKFMSRGASI